MPGGGEAPIPEETFEPAPERVELAGRDQRSKLVLKCLASCETAAEACQVGEEVVRHRVARIVPDHGAQLVSV